MSTLPLTPRPAAAGEARNRFGGNVPLIGISPWGCVRDREKLVAPDGNDRPSHLSKDREILYAPSRFVRKDLPILDCNHTHFILVDHGKVGDYGSEVPLRASFEAHACAAPGNDEEDRLARHLEANGLHWKGQREYWKYPGTSEPQELHGARPPGAADGAAGSSERRSSFALCLCFEGGAGSVKTVAEAVRNRLPALIMNSTGRAADLISDCVRIYDCSRGPAEGDEGGATVERAHQDPFDRVKVRRIVQLKKLLVFMQDIFDRTHGVCGGAPTAPEDGGDRWVWPLTREQVYRDRPEDRAGEWKEGDLWRLYHRYVAGTGKDETGWRLQDDSDSLTQRPRDSGLPAVLLPGRVAHVECAMQLALHVFKDYRLGCSAKGALDTACQLFDCCRTRLCVIYDVDARVMRGGNPEPLDVLEYVVKSLVRGMQEEADRRKLRMVLWWWRSHVMQIFAARMPALLQSMKMEEVERCLTMARFLKGVCHIPDRQLLNEFGRAELQGLMRVEQINETVKSYRPVGGTLWSRFVAVLLQAEMQVCANRTTPSESLDKQLTIMCEEMYEEDRKADCTDGEEQRHAEIKADELEHARKKTHELIDIEKDKELQELRILIEWGNVDMVRMMLDVVGDERARYWTSARTVAGDESGAILLDKDLLNHALHLSLKQKNVELTRLFLDRGASSELYSKEHRMKAKGVTPWKWLLASACEAMHDRDQYLRKLVLSSWAFNSAIFAVSFRHKEEEAAESALDLIKRKYKKQQNRTVLSQDPDNYDDSLGQEYVRDERLTKGLERIQDDFHARIILNHMVQAILSADEGDGLTLAEASTSTDFDLFVFVLMTGGTTELAKIFWERDGRYNPSLLLQNALFACILCRKLQNDPSVGPKVQHLKEGFERTANDFEDLASVILERASGLDFERARLGLELHFESLGEQRTLDLVIQGNCRHLVKQCSRLMTDAVERRFGSLSVAVHRLDESVVQTVGNLLGPDSWVQSFARRLWPRKEDGSAQLAQDGRGTAPHPPTGQYLFVCVVLDSLILAHLFTLQLPLSVDLLFSTLTIAAVYHMFGNTWFSAMVIAEELVPLLSSPPFPDVIPSATIAWVLHAWFGDRPSCISPDGARAKVRRDRYLPADYFVVDLLAHLFVTLVLTQLIMCGIAPAQTSAWDDWIELSALALFLLDEFPDILLEGLDRQDTQDFRTIILEGFRKYIKISGCVSL
jgi:hypothetical protein